jgi:mono/diheme cytochrome c family protein
MRALSRDSIVGFLLLCSFIFFGGCQPVRPVDAAGKPIDHLIRTESVPITETVSLVVSEALTATGEVTSTGTSAASEEAVDPALVAAGLAAYRAQYCGVCHTSRAAETRGIFGPTHDGLSATVVAYFATGSYTGSATTPAAYVRESIVDPQAWIVPGYAATPHRMPAYTHLDAATVDALVAFLLAH